MIKKEFSVAESKALTYTFTYIHDIQSTKVDVFVSVPGLISFSIDFGVGQEIDRAKTTCSFMYHDISEKCLLGLISASIDFVM